MQQTCMNKMQMTITKEKLQHKHENDENVAAGISRSLGVGERILPPTQLIPHNLPRW